MSKTKLLILYTGGTLGMGYKTKGDETSPLVPLDWSTVYKSISIFSPQSYFTKEKGIIFKFLKFKTAIDSSEINPSHWKKILEIINKNYANFDGFIIIHGTDTMAYTASALSFAIQGLKKPIVLTGSQLPVFHSRTDAINNLSNAVHIAAAKVFGHKTIPEVLICFNDKLMRGNRATKSSSRDFSGFETPSFPILGDLNEPIKISNELVLKFTDKEFKILPEFESNIIIITLFPGFNHELFKTIAQIKNLKGVILRTFGSGNAPTDIKFLNSLKQLKQKGKIVVNISQCIEGNIDTTKYKTGKLINDCGVLSSGNMTLETATAKLMWLLGNYNNNKIQELFVQNLKGEMN
ncbi:MAG: asparaginase [Bacteroidetes bacterium]|nr:asparaginase [Bacteroidota bacterium]